MPKFKDLTGKRFFRWLVLERSTQKVSNRATWICKCDCGTIKTVLPRSLVTGASRSCGCWALEFNTKHGDWQTRFYGVWANMKDRCLNPKCSNYHNYGGRGITVCEAWIDDYRNFKKDMFEGYAKGLTLDRIDNEKGYYKENCRWTSMQVQRRNSRQNRKIKTVYGDLLLVEASEISGVHISALRSRLRNGIAWDLLLTPTNPRLRK